MLLLNSNQIGDAGVAALGAAAGKGALCNVTKLCLSHNRISCEGATALVWAEKKGQEAVAAALRTS